MIILLMQYDFTINIILLPFAFVNYRTTKKQASHTGLPALLKSNKALLILALSCSLRLLLALYAGLLVAFSLAELCQGPRASDLTLEATECAV